MFRHGVIAEILRLPAGHPAIGRQLRRQSERTHTIPGSRRNRIGVSTLRSWARLYRTGGLDALRPKPRRDRGRPRRLPAAVADLLIEIKERHPRWAVRKVIERARESGKVPAEARMARSTVYRLLRNAGLTSRGDPSSQPKARRRFSFRHAGELWMTDYMHGPQTGCDPADRRRRKKAHLLCFLDDATRYIPHATFTCGESTALFLPAFKTALIRCGIPERLYTDNGSAYCSSELARICASLNISLIHTRPYTPQGRGKIERFFRTVRSQLLPELGSAGTRSLDALNQRLGSWIEGEYHRAPHSGLGNRDCTPLERWPVSSPSLRPVGPETDLTSLFLEPVRRKVYKDCTVRFKNRIYEVDAGLIGEFVTLLHDASAPPDAPLPVQHQGASAGRATVLDSYANALSRGERPAVERRPPGQDQPAGSRDDPAGIPLRRLQGKDPS